MITETVANAQAPRLRLNGRGRGRGRLDLPSIRAAVTAIFAEVAPLFDLAPPDRIGIGFDALTDEFNAAVRAVCRMGPRRTLPPPARVAPETSEEECFTAETQENLRRAIRRALQPLTPTHKQRLAIIAYDARLITYELLLLLAQRYRLDWTKECEGLVELYRKIARG